jgi:hypothetical protein
MKTSFENSFSRWPWKALLPAFTFFLAGMLLAALLLVRGTGTPLLMFLCGAVGTALFGHAILVKSKRGSLPTQRQRHESGER